MKHLFLSTILFACAAHGATILVDNLTEATRDTTVIHAGEWAAQSFITDANLHSLAGITTVLGEAIGAPAVVAELRRDTLTGLVVTTFLTPDLSGPLSDISLNPAGSVTLDANTTYWLIFGVLGGGQYGWSYARGDNFAGPGVLSAYGYSTDLGATWDPARVDVADPYKIRVTVDAVPEPSTLLTSLAALLVICASRRGSRCRRASFGIRRLSSVF
jgi:hypothetical protein